MASPDNENATAVFSQKLVTSLEECIGKHPMNRSGRTKIFGAFHQLRSSQAFKSEWANFLQKGATTDADPTFYQYVVGEIFDEILKQHCPIVQPTSGVTSQEELSLSYEEQNALRYAAGYIPRALTKKLHTSAHPLKDQLTLCLIDLTDDADDISSDSQECNGSRRVKAC